MKGLLKARLAGSETRSCNLANPGVLPIELCWPPVADIKLAPVADIMLTPCC